MRFAICNETFEGWDHARVCRSVTDAGYDGLEVAPFTLAPRITDVPPARRAELRQQAEDAGVEIIGLHWLLAKTEGLHLTSPDARGAASAPATTSSSWPAPAATWAATSWCSARRRSGASPPATTPDQADRLRRRHLPHGRAGHRRRGVHAVPGAAVAAETDFINTRGRGRARIADCVDHPLRACTST